MGDLMANVLLRLCLAVLVVACVQSETDESDSQVQLLSDAAEANTLVVLLDEGKGKGKGNKGATQAAKMAKKIAKGFKLKGAEKVAFPALTKKAKEAGKNAKKYKKKGSKTLKTIKKQEEKMRKSRRVQKQAKHLELLRAKKPPLKQPKGTS